jgi:hypothetical protein
VILVWDIPVDVGRDEARAAAERELSDPAYAAAQPSFLERIIDWLGARLDDLFTGVASLSTGGIVGLVVLALLAVLAGLVIRQRVGKVARTLRGRSVVLDGKPLSAREHRRLAEEAAARGDLEVAVRERFRAIVRELEERGVLDEVSGRTVDEIAARAGQVLPAHADALWTGARIFDDVVYGGQPATVDGYGTLVALDNQVQSARPALAAP